MQGDASVGGGATVSGDAAASGDAGVQDDLPPQVLQREPPPNARPPIRRPPVTPPWRLGDETSVMEPLRKQPRQNKVSEPQPPNYPPPGFESASEASAPSAPHGSDTFVPAPPPARPAPAPASAAAPAVPATAPAARHQLHQQSQQLHQHLPHQLPHQHLLHHLPNQLLSHMAQMCHFNQTQMPLEQMSVLTDGFHVPDCRVGRVSPV